MSQEIAVSASDAPKSKLSGGCLMILVVFGWLLALGLWMVWHLLGQVKEMRGFTDPSAQTVVPDVPSAEQKSALLTRIKAFTAAMEAKQMATLELTVSDLNHLLGGQDPISRLQDIAKVEAITDVIRVKVALALNGIPFTGERLWLNGAINVRPEVRKETGLMLITRSIEVPGRTLTPGFSKTYLDANHLDGLALNEIRKDEKINGLLSKITAVRCDAGKVIVEYLP